MDVLKRLLVHFFCMQKCLRILLHMQKYSEAFLHSNDWFTNAFFFLSLVCKNASEYFCTHFLFRSTTVSSSEHSSSTSWGSHAICCGPCHVKDRYFVVMALILLLDSSSPATMLYTPCLEHMTVAIKEPTVTKPKYRLVYVCS